MIAADIIKIFKLQPNTAEGGYFAGIYESQLHIPDNDLPGFPSTGNSRSLCGAIYYFLDDKGPSVMHRVTGDMIYHFYNGHPVQMLLLYPDGHSEVCVFSNNIQTSGNPMKSIPGGTWLGSRLITGGKYALMGVTMAPGFHPNDYTIGKRSELIEKFPSQKQLIESLTN
jgi:predicted cupin superfamily sugar epimerase